MVSNCGRMVSVVVVATVAGDEIVMDVLGVMPVITDPDRKYSLEEPDGTDNVSGYPLAVSDKLNVSVLTCTA